MTLLNGCSLLSRNLIKLSERSKNHSEITRVISVRAGSHGEYNFAPWMTYSGPKCRGIRFVAA